MAVLVAAAAVYIGPVAPARWIRESARRAAGDPPYESAWGLVAHALLYTTLVALLSAILWTVLAHRGWMEAIRPIFRMPSRADWIRAGLVTLAVCAFNLGLYAASGGAIRPHAVSPWIVAGNLFSNFYEEFLWRGFLLSASLVALNGHRTAAVAVNAVLFAVSHDQYPLPLQLMVGVAGLAFAWLTLNSRSLWPAYAAHQLGDMILDPLL